MVIWQIIEAKNVNLVDNELNEYINSIEEDETFDDICNDVREEYTNNYDNLETFIPGFHD